MFVEGSKPYTDALKVARDQLLTRNSSLDYLQQLLEEYFLTQRGLAAMGLDIESGLSENLKRVPSVNKLVLPSGRPNISNNSPLIIEIAGSPKTGKTTMIESFSLSSGIEIESPQEVAEFAKGWWKKRASGKEPDLRSMDTSIQVLNVINQAFARKKHAAPITILDRSRVDEFVFRRAKFIGGILKDLIANFPRKIADISKEYPDALIVCVTTPTISLDREGPREQPGLVMNEKFLGILLLQYLRLHNEILALGKPPFPYALLDMSSTNYENNQDLFNQTLQSMFGYFGVKTKESEEF